MRRTENRGRVTISSTDVRSAFNIREHLHDGRLTIFLGTFDEQVSVGDTFVFRGLLSRSIARSPRRDGK